MSRWDATRTCLVPAPAPAPASCGGEKDKDTDAAAAPAPASGSSPRGEQYLAADYLYRALHISSQTFKSVAGSDVGAVAVAGAGATSGEGLLMAGKFSALIQKFALASCQSSQVEAEAGLRQGSGAPIARLVLRITGRG